MKIFLPLTISSFNVNTKYIQSRRVQQNPLQGHSSTVEEKKSIYMNTFMPKKQSMPHSQRHSVVLRNALALMLLLATRMNVHSYRATNLHKSRHLRIRLPCAGAFFTRDFVNTLLLS